MYITTPSPMYLSLKSFRFPMQSFKPKEGFFSNYTSNSFILQIIHYYPCILFPQVVFLIKSCIYLSLNFIVKCRGILSIASTYILQKLSYKKQIEPILHGFRCYFRREATKIFHQTFPSPNDVTQKWFQNMVRSLHICVRVTKKFSSSSSSKPLPVYESKCCKKHNVI